MNKVPLKVCFLYHIKENIFDIMTENKCRNVEGELLLKYLSMSSKNRLENQKDTLKKKKKKEVYKGLC